MIKEIKSMLKLGKVRIVENTNGKLYLHFTTEFGYECTPIEITSEHPFAKELLNGMNFHNCKKKFDEKEIEEIEEGLMYSDFR